jgi:hypothetical protein
MERRSLRRAGHSGLYRHRGNRETGSYPGSAAYSGAVTEEVIAQIHQAHCRQGDIEGARAGELVVRDVRDLVPSNAAVGLAEADGRLTVIAVSDAALYTVQHAGSRDETIAATKPLAPGQVSVQRKSDYSSTTKVADVNRQMVEVQAHIHHWTFSWNDGYSLSFDGVVEAQDFGRNLFPDSAERVARVLAKRLGWPLPDA